jgi:hypothetical protein
MNTPASSKSNLVPYSVDSDNIPIDLKDNIESSLMGKEESLMASGQAEMYGKTEELKMIELMLLMRTRKHYCVVAEMLK